jgi:predicted secreted protein
MVYREKLLVLAVILGISSILIGASLADITICPVGCNYNSIQAAVDAAMPNDILNAFNISTSGGILVDKSLTIGGLAANGQRPMLKADNGSAAIISADKVTLKGFQFPVVASSGSAKDCSMLIVNSKGNWIYLNDFANMQGICSEGSSSWNSSKTINYQYNSKVFSGYLGNYWSNYAGSDANGDGIGDQPSVIDANNVDYYPLIEPSENYIIAGEKLEAENMILAKLNKPFNITLDSNPTTGYTWTIDFDSQFLHKENDSYTPSRPGLIGSGGQQIFTFIPIRAGNTTVSAVYKRSWENIVADERTYDIVISG